MLDLIAIALTIGFIAYCGLSFIQFRYQRYLDRHGARRFPKTKRSVSVVMPILSDDPELEKYIVSACEQDYPNYDVLLVSNVEGEPGASVGIDVASRYDHVRHVFVGAHDPAERVGKNHALLGSLDHIEGEVVLFSDADLEFERDWVQRMVSPIGRKHNGRVIRAVGAPVIVLGRNRLGRFFTLSSNLVMYLAAFARQSQTFPAYLSGHSMAIERELVVKEVAPYWTDTYNDDLILAYVLRERDHALYYNPGVILRPQENMASWSRLHKKIVRWGITVRRFQHPAMRNELTRGGFLNGQVAIGLPLSVVLFLLGYPCLALIVLGAFYVQAVVFRYIIARSAGERFGALILATPISYTIFMTVFGHYYFWGRRFTWGGHDYYIKESFRMDGRTD